MKYKPYHFAAFGLAAVILTIASLAGIRYIVEPLMTDPRALHDFFFHRSAIQWMTLGVFFFTLSMLIHRLISYSSMLSGIRDLAENLPLQKTMRSQAVAQRFERVRKCKEEHGPSVAASYSRELASRDEEELERIYGLLSNAIQLMVALGFLGTVWGISQKMLGFGNLAEASTELLKKLLGDFSQGLSTALDTTVLGLISSLIATIAMAIVKWSETDAFQALDEVVCTRLSLETAIHKAAEPWHLIKAELTALISSIVRTMEAAMSELVIRSAQAFEIKLSEAVQQQLNRVQEHERRISEILAEALKQQIVLTLKTLEEQGAQTRMAITKLNDVVQQQLTHLQEHENRVSETLTRTFMQQSACMVEALKEQEVQTCTVLTTELRSIAEQLQRVPEISIRYPGMNGSGLDSQKGDENYATFDTN